MNIKGLKFLQAWLIVKRWMFMKEETTRNSNEMGTNKMDLGWIEIEKL